MALAGLTLSPIRYQVPEDKSQVQMLLQLHQAQIRHGRFLVVQKPRYAYS